jgi:hypothetical protein
MKFTANSIRRHTSLIGLVGLTTFTFTAVACSDDEDTIPLTEWVAEFDQVCVETVAALSDPDLSEAEFAEVSDAAIDEMRAIGEPDEMADTAAGLLDAIAANADGIERTQSEIGELDQQAFAAMTSLGVSDACIGGPQG